MIKGSRCKHTKQGNPFQKIAIIFILLLAGWGYGNLITNSNIPMPVKILISLFSAVLIIILRRQKKFQPASRSIQPTEKEEQVKIPFENTTSSLLDPNFAAQILTKSHQYQLELLCSTLNLTSCAIILHHNDHCILHSIHSTTPEATKTTLDDPGILMSLNENRPEISGHPSSPKFQGLPYYKKGATVGGFMAISLKGIDKYHLLKGTGVLCVDRSAPTPWTEREQNHIRNSAQKINIDLYVTEQLFQNNRDRKAINQICLALQNLNGALNLKEAFTATQKTVTGFTSATLVAVTLKDSMKHTVVSVAGLEENIEGLIITDKTCLVNQVIALQHTMAPKGTQQNPVTLFTTPSPIDTYESLLIIPLIIDNKPIGTLIIGGAPPKLFSKDEQALLEVVAGQIATRIDLAQTHEKVQRMATIDGLTGLVNHRTFQNGLAKMIARAARQKTEVALILCDIDHFKKVNDNYGHPFGDEVLKQVAHVLKEAMRSIDLAARYGGEEFTLVLENATAAGGLKLAERIREEIAALQFFHQDEEVRVTMSFGVSSYPALAPDQTTLISQADKALYDSKEGGRNQVLCYQAQ